MTHGMFNTLNNEDAYVATKMLSLDVSIHLLKLSLDIPFTTFKKTLLEQYGL